MKRLFLCAFALVMGVSAMAADDPKWQDPNVFEENRLPMRSTFIVAPTAEQAPGVHDFTASPLYKSIGGIWKFYWTENATDPQPKDFFAQDFDDSAWKSMPVPGMWEMNGFGDPLYSNDGYAWQNFYKKNPDPNATNKIRFDKGNPEATGEMAAIEVKDLQDFLGRIVREDRCAVSIINPSKEEA